MGKKTIDVNPGDIFTIPLFLPSYQNLDAGVLNDDCFIFCMYSSSKKMLKEFAISFHKLVMDADIFEEFLKQLT